MYYKADKKQLSLRNGLLLALLCLLFSCSTNHRPAPVVVLEGSNSKPSYKKPKTTMGIHSSTYKVKKGETLYSIAWRSGKDVKTLAQLNNLSPPFNIYPDQILRLTAKSGKSKVRTNNNTKTVKKVLTTSEKVVANQTLQEYGESSGEKFDNVEVPSLKQKVDSWGWPVKGKIIKKFSSSAIGNKGINIAGRHGQPVKAAAAGLIVYAGNALRGYGNLIIIKHNDDYLSAYAHNDQLLVKEQQQVKRGQVIAKMGNTGSDKTMLHFEIRFRGKSVNPLRYLPKK
ncbi:peptidoglycan DD-metalloendopeptidase family protein [Thalassotalea aquiviva]|uniref:peptidoglycan DD-metalloendopeptidase family protein n=1 Tax=Thalassotalea aquiviva TaxID=3242415 RepID=UPI00352A3FC0